jgi:undecaprenyl pyrophosphate synthase
VPEIARRAVAEWAMCANFDPRWEVVEAARRRSTDRIGLLPEAVDTRKAPQYSYTLHCREFSL